MSALLGHGGGSVGVDTGDIGHSLRFRSAASAYLSRTITTDATSTYFAAVKRGKLGVVTPIFDSSIKFNANDTLTAFGLTTTAVFRDPTSWLFIHVSNGGLYVNGVSYGAVTTSSITNPRIGYDGTNYADMYVARIGVVGGTSSSYTNFGYQNTEINEWVTKSQSAVKAVVDAGGTNSFMLDFDDGTSLTTLGYDKSSKGNNWTLNNVSLTAGSTYDWMLDVPGNSYCTANPLEYAVHTFSNANLTVTTSAGGYYTSGSTQFMSSGKWYAEVTNTTNANTQIGIVKEGFSGLTQLANQPNGYSYYATSGNKYNNGSSAAYGATYTSGDVIGVAYDADNGKLYFSKNGTWQNSGDPVAGTGFAYSGLSGNFTVAVGDGGTSAATLDLNFGQRPFAYTPPTGFKALCQANLPDPAIKNPEKHFDVLLYNGNTTARNVQGASFQPDLVWSKERGAARSHCIVDSMRGVYKYLSSDSTSAETTDGSTIDQFLSDGFHVGSSLLVNANDAYVSWLWKAGGASLLQNNLVTNTSDFSSYGLFGGVVTANTDVAPDGTTTADTINDNTTSVFGGVYSQQQIPLTQNRRITCSVYIKKDAVGKATRYPSIRITTSTGYYADIYFDTSTGETYAGGNLSGVSGGKTDAGSYWLVYVSAYDPAAGVAWARCDIFPSIGANASLGSGISVTVTGSIVAWGLKAEYDSSISSQVSANVDAGFSIVTYTGTGANATVGHGLGVAPKMVILKSRNNADAWPVFHGSMANTEYILLNTAAAKVSGSTFWNSTSPTSTVFSIGAVSGAFQAVALCFAEIPQFSKIGSYTGNGSADGPFVECGFKPKYVMIKAVTAGDSNSDWIIYDTVRSPYNAADYRLYANGDYAEWNSAVYGLDILSSGFKPRNGMANYGFNTSGVTYIFYAVADVASKYSLAR